MDQAVHKDSLNVPDGSISLMISVIEEINALDPLGRLNESTKRRKDIGSQHTLWEYNGGIFTPFFNMLREIGKQNFKQFKISDAWTNYNPPNGVNKPHSHVGSDISGCFYLQVPHNSGRINFEHGEDFMPSPKDVFWWRSDMVHWVDQNLSDQTRISIAFNIKEIA